SRHDIDRLDRKLAYSWLQEHIQSYLSLPKQFSELLGPDCGVTYVACTLKEKLSEVIRSNPDTLKFVFSSDIADWDTATGHFKAMFYRLLSEDIAVQIFIPHVPVEQEIKRFLS